MKRAESGDRADDNLETLRKRFKSYEEIQLPIINIYKEQVKFIIIKFFLKFLFEGNM